MKNSINHNLILKTLLIYSVVLLVAVLLAIAVLAFRLISPPNAASITTNPQLNTIEKAIELINDQTLTPSLNDPIPLPPPSTQSASPSATRGD
jgi:hypothetical protein